MSNMYSSFLMACEILDSVKCHVT